MSATASITLSQYLPAELSVGEPDVTPGLAVFPLFGPQPRLNYLSFAEGAAAGVTVRELPQGGIGQRRARRQPDGPARPALRGGRADRGAAEPHGRSRRPGSGRIDADGAGLLRGGGALGPWPAWGGVHPVHAGRVPQPAPGQERADAGANGRRARGACRSVRRLVGGQREGAADGRALRDGRDERHLRGPRRPPRRRAGGRPASRRAAQGRWWPWAAGSRSWTR